MVQVHLKKVDKEILKEILGEALKKEASPWRIAFVHDTIVSMYKGENEYIGIRNGTWVSTNSSQLVVHV